MISLDCLHPIRLILRTSAALIIAVAGTSATVRGDPPTYSTGVKRVILQTFEEWQAGKPLGDGGQQMTGLAQCRENPNIIYLTQDVGPPRVSVDGGISWFYPQWTGMRSFLTQGVMCDPLDPRRVAVTTNEFYVGQTGQAGLYVSFDGGQTAVRKIVWNPQLSSVHAASQGIGFNPASESGGKANRWVFIGPSSGLNPPVYHSTDGMVTWQQRTTLSYSTYGLVKHIIGDPSNNNVYYVAFSTGLYRITNAHTGTFTITKLSGVGGLETGTVNGPPYVSANGQTIIVGVQNKGVFRSTNGGSNWTKIHTQTDLHKLFVNWMNTNYMAITIHASGNAGRPLFSQNGGSSFAVPASIEKRPGFTGTVSPGYQHCHVAWVNGSGELWYAGRQTSLGAAQSDFRSSDGGQNLTLSMKGMNGCHLGGANGTQMFDPVNKNRIGAPFIDVHWVLSDDGLKSFQQFSITAPVRVAGSHSTVNGAILHPTLNRAVVCMDKQSDGYIYVFNNGTWTYTGSGSVKGHGLCYNPNTLVAFGAGLRSTDGWLTWSSNGGPGSGYVAVGCSTHAATKAIFAVDRDASPVSRNIKRTTNDGSSWTVILTASYRLDHADVGLNPITPHPTNHNIIFTRAENGRDIRRWDLSSGSGPSSRDFTDLDPSLGLGSADFQLGWVAIDPRFPDVMYARNTQHGSTAKVTRSTDGGNTWTNISHLVPRGQGTFMKVHPLTGELLITTSGGMWLIDPPYAQSGKLGDSLQYPGNMLQGNYLDAGVGIFTANEDIGSPGLAGSASYNAGTYTVTGGGADIYGTSDQFRFVHEGWSGDGRLIARVVSQTTPVTHNWAKAGVMFRDNTNAGARNVDLIIAPNPPVNGSVQMLARATAGGTTSELGRIDGKTMPYWVRLERHGNIFTGWHSLDGLTWFVTGTTTLALNNSLRAGLAVTAHDNTKLNTATFDDVSLAAVPVWTFADVGSVGAAGGTVIDYATDVFTLNGAGANIWSTADSFHFCYVSLTGDATIVAEVTSVENTHQHAKGGLMIRQSLTNNAAHATINLKPGDGASPGVEFLRRTTPGGTGGHSSGSPVAGVTPPRFLKLVRSGNNFSGYHSSDSITWTQIGVTETISMTGTVYIGLISCSIINTTNLCTAKFESVFVK